MKPISHKQIIMSSFNFTYAGMCFVTIIPDKHKYRVVSNGVQIYKDICFFARDYKVRYSYDDLYTAICQFNYLIKRITESMDWFKPDHFNLNNFEKVRLKEL